MARRALGNGFFLLSAAATIVVATAAVCAPVVKPKEKANPAEEPATPAIDPAKLADSAPLRLADARNVKISHKNLEALALGVHNYAGTYDSKLPAGILDKDGKPLLSWRVQLLPYLEQDELYKKFRLDEPWDSKHNLALLELMPRVFASPRVVVKRKGYTVYQVFTGPDAVFNAGKTIFKIGTIPDGTSNTLFAVEASKAVPWTKPADIPFDKAKAVPDFGKAYGKRPLGALLDGSVRMLDLNKISAETLKHAIMPADGNVLGRDWIE
jgi:hypothetical protein